MKKSLGEAVFTTIITTILTSLMTVIIANFVIDKSTITIGNPTELNEEVYYLPISINTYNEEIENLRISFPANIDINHLKTSIPISIKQLMEANTMTEQSSFELDVPSESHVQIIATFTESIDEENVYIYKNGNKVKVSSFDTMKRPIIEQLPYFLISITAYAIIIFILTLWQEKRRNEKIDHYITISNSSKEAYNDLKESIKNERTQLNKVQDELKQTRDDFTKKQILNSAKLNDYSKELNFWRNTIRKVLYELPDGEEKADKVLKSISSSLKTYQTQNQEFDFEALRILSKMLEDRKTK